jgi:hypothetical protein
VAAHAPMSFLVNSRSFHRLLTLGDSQVACMKKIRLNSYFLNSSVRTIHLFHCKHEALKNSQKRHTPPRSLARAAPDRGPPKP